MIKKAAYILIMALMPVLAQGQVAVGNWLTHTPFSGVEKMVETNNQIFYISAGSVYSIDKATMEVRSLSASGTLNETQATGLFGEPSGKSVIVAYSSGNMDRIYDNGKIVNIPDIKDASSLSGARNINSIAFGNENFYVATSFGLVTYNNKKNEVKETVFTPQEVKMVAANKEYVMVKINNQLKFARQSDKINHPDKLKLMGNYTKSHDWTAMEGTAEADMFLVVDRTQEQCNLHILKVDMDANTASDYRLMPSATNDYVKNVSRYTGWTKGYPYVVNPQGVFVVKDEQTIEMIPIARANAQNECLTYSGDAASVWEGNALGVRNFDYSTSTPTLRHDYITGTDLTVPAVNLLTMTDNGDLYLSNLCEHLTFGISPANPRASKVNILRGGKFIDNSGVDVERTSNNNPSKTAPYFVNNSMRMFPDPTDPDAYYIGSWFEGCYRIKNGKQTHHYTTANSPLTTQYGGYTANVTQPIVDRHGNLWLYAYSDVNNGNRVFALPASKRMSENVTAADWRTMNFGTLPSDDKRDGFGIVCKNSDYILFAPGRWVSVLMIIDTKGTETLNDDTCHFVRRYVDQDGKQLSFSHLLALCEDHDGRIWVGTDTGVFYIKDISKAVEDPVQIVRPKIARNDGTGLADYLCDATMVSSIAVDAANRKWISTIGSGAYLVNSEGTELLNNFMASNSMLPNTVYDVACDKNSNKVYFGTSSGLIEYSSTSSPASEDYSEVYAYPNPVRPDYTGWITVTGLMDNSLVKITDAAGNLVYESRSDGGMMTWDGCNLHGEPVRSGVYYVMASQNGSGKASACVTKIVVIK